MVKKWYYSASSQWHLDDVMVSNINFLWFCWFWHIAINSVDKLLFCFITFSGVSTVGHGWARAHPTSARVGREICTKSKSFYGGVRVGVADSAWAWRYTVCLLWTHYENAFVHCRLYIHIWLLGALPPYPAGLYPWSPLGTSVPQTPCAHPTSKPWLRHWLHLLT